MRNPEVTAIVGSTRSLQRVEDGEATGLTYPIIAALCDLYEVPPEEKFELQRLWRLGDVTMWTQPRGRSVFGYDAYRDLELHANVVEQYEVNFVPGHLQSERTMRMLFARNPDFDEAEMERQVDQRVRAQVPFWQGQAGRRYHFLLNEAILRDGCDADQINRLIEADALDHATVRYLPFGSGPHSLLNLPFTLLSFTDDNDSDIVYVEAADAYLYFEEAESVRYYRTSLDTSEDRARSVKEFKL